MRELDSESESIKFQHRTTAQARADMFRLAQSQREALATNFSGLLGDGGPSEETADEMIQALREWRDTSSNRSLD
jgi:hypothetical protein